MPPLLQTSPSSGGVIRFNFLNMKIRAINSAWCAWRIVFMCAAICFVAAPMFGQNFRFQKFGLENGLSNQIVTTVFRDKTGFLWVGTENGLNRYDGYNFKHFLPDAKNVNALRDGLISTLHEDRRGNFWVGTKAGGLHLFDRRTETFRAFQHDAKNPNSLSDNRIYRIFEDTNGDLWIGTAGGLDKISWDGANSDSVKIVSFRSDANNAESLSHNRVQAIARDAAGQLWIGTKNGLNKMLSESPPRFQRFNHDKNNPNAGLPDDEVYGLLPDSAGNLWIALWGGGGLTQIPAAEISNPQPNFRRFPFDEKTGTGLKDDIVLNLIEDSRGNLWFCNGDFARAAFLSKDERSQPNPRFVSFGSDEADAASLGDGSVVSIFEDAQGLIWIAAMEGGLNKFDVNKSAFEIFRHYPGRIQSLPESLANDVVEDADGSLWVANEKGLTNIVPGNSPFAAATFTNFRAEPKRAGGLSEDTIASLLIDSKNRLWVGTINGGLQLREQTGGKISFKTFVKDKENLQTIGNNAILTMTEDANGGIWIGTYQGLYKVIEATAETSQITFAAFRNQNDNPESLSSDIVESLTAGTDGSVWVGTTSGLNRLDSATGKVTRFEPETDNPNSLAHEYVGSLLTAKDGTIFIGTKSGLCRFDAAAKTIRRFAAGNALSNLSIQSLVQDADGKIWAGTINGLFRVDFDAGTAERWSKNEGIAGEIFSRGGATLARNGTLYFGGTEGVTAFNPRNLKTNDFAPPVVLTDFLLANKIQNIGGDSILPAHVQFLDKITLSHTDNIFTVEFSALNFRQPENNRFAYRLEGLHDDWIETDGKNRRATFTNLNPGEYVFRVKAANNDGVWNAEGAKIKIVILPPWWKTWWAQILFYASISALLLAVPFVRLSVLKKQRSFLETQVSTRTTELREANQQLIDANRAKSAFLSNMSHELRTPLNAVIGFAQLMARDAKLSGEQRGNLGIIQRSGEHLLGLINDVLSISKIEAGRLSLAAQSFDSRKMLRSVEEMLCVRAEVKNLSLKFEIAPDLPVTISGDEGKLRQVLVNLVGNAIKFTETGGVIVRCDWRNDQAFFEIADTGVGIAENEIGRLFEAFFQTASGQNAADGTGLGLAISRQIVRLMGGDIKVASKLNSGTTFSFDINLPASAEVKQVEQRRVIGLVANQIAPRILVVDDKLENRALLMKLLAQIGFEVREAANGRQAVEVWQKWKPNLIFMDLRMPILDGYAATEQIRALESNSINGAKQNAVKIIALTASAFEHERGTIIEQGANDFVSKPFREATIFEKITQHLGTRFDYENETTENESADDAPAAVMSAKRFAVVAPETLARLERALRLGDDAAAVRVADEIAVTEPALAAAIQRAVKDFDFDVVLQAMSKNTEKVHR